MPDGNGEGHQPECRLVAPELHHQCERHGVLRRRCGVRGKALWKSDGTANGTVLVKDVNPDPNMAANVFLQSRGFNGQLFFTAHDGTHGVELGNQTAPVPAP